MTSPYDTGGQSSDTFARLQRQLAARNAQPAVPSVDDQLNELEEELEGFATDTAVAAATTAVHDLLCLKDYAPEINLCAVWGEERGLVYASYLWYLEEHFEQALSWMRAHGALERDYRSSQNFFVSAFVD